ISIVCFLLLTMLDFASLVRSQSGPGSDAKSAQGNNEQTMQALLNEVRQLRLAIQRSNLNVYHAQVIIERIRSQQQSVDRLADRLRDTRNQLAGIKMPQAEIQAELKRIEGRMNLEQDAKERQALEEQQETLKARLGMFAQEENRLRD